MRKLLFLLLLFIFTVTCEKVEDCHLYNLTIINYSIKKVRVKIDGEDSKIFACGVLNPHWFCSFDELEPRSIKIEIFDFETNELMKEKVYNLNQCEEVYEIK